MAKVLVIGGTPLSLLNFRGPLLVALMRDGHDVVACAAPGAKDITESLKSLGVVFLPIPVKRASISFLSDIKLFYFIIRLIIAQRPDIVLAYTVKPVIYGGIASRLSGISNYYAMITGLGYALSRGSYKQRVVELIVRFLYRSSLERAMGVFFQNPDDEEFFIRNKLITSSQKVIRLNGSGVNLETFQPKPLPDQPVFSLIARLLVDKGLREFYSAAKNIKKKYPKTRFLIAGAVDENPTSIPEEELKSWINEGVIEFHGWLADVRQFLSETQVYVLPSYGEGTPRSVLEAMAMGRPIITTNAPGCRETVIDGRNGFLVPPRDSLSLELAMERFLLDPTLASRMGASSLDLVRAKYDVNKVNEVIIDALDSDSNKR